MGAAKGQEEKEKREERKEEETPEDVGSSKPSIQQLVKRQCRISQGGLQYIVGLKSGL